MLAWFDEAVQSEELFCTLSKNYNKSNLAMNHLQDDANLVAVSTNGLDFPLSLSTTI